MEIDINDIDRLYNILTRYRKQNEGKLTYKQNEFTTKLILKIEKKQNKGKFW